MVAHYWYSGNLDGEEIKLSECKTKIMKMGDLKTLFEPLEGLIEFDQEFFNGETPVEEWHHAILERIPGELTHVYVPQKLHQTLTSNPG